MAKILVIDDAAVLLSEVLGRLMFEDHGVISAADGQKGVETALDTLPDLVLCDIDMPRLNGFEALQSLRSTSATNTIPLIFLTARSEFDDIDAKKTRRG